MNIALKWLAVAGSLVVLTGVAGRMHFARGADEGPAPERRLEAGDTAGRLDRLIEKLDRVVDRMQAERRGPPDRPQHGGPGGPGGRRGPGERGERGPEERGEYGERGEHDGPREQGGPGMRGEGRPGRPDRPDRPGQGPWADVPPEVREMFQRRMEEGRKRMEEARVKFQEMEERIKKLEAEVERLKNT